MGEEGAGDTTRWACVACMALRAEWQARPRAGRAAARQAAGELVTCRCAHCLVRPCCTRSHAHIPAQPRTCGSAATAAAGSAAGCSATGSNSGSSSSGSSSSGASAGRTQTGIAVRMGQLPTMVSSVGGWPPRHAARLCRTCPATTLSSQNTCPHVLNHTVMLPHLAPPAWAAQPPAPAPPPPRQQATPEWPLARPPAARAAPPQPAPLAAAPQRGLQCAGRCSGAGPSGGRPRTTPRCKCNTHRQAAALPAQAAAPWRARRTCGRLLCRGRLLLGGVLGRRLLLLCRRALLLRLRAQKVVHGRRRRRRWWRAVALPVGLAILLAVVALQGAVRAGAAEWAAGAEVAVCSAPGGRRERGAAWCWHQSAWGHEPTCPWPHGSMASLLGSGERPGRAAGRGRERGVRGGPSGDGAAPRSDLWFAGPGPRSVGGASAEKAALLPGCEREHTSGRLWRSSASHRCWDVLIGLPGHSPRMLGWGAAQQQAREEALSALRGIPPIRNSRHCTAKRARAPPATAAPGPASRSAQAR